MKSIISLVALLSVLLFTSASATSATTKELTLEKLYIRPDGSIMTLTTGQLVDPYFPTKSLLIALDSGMNVSKLGNDWIKWMLARQDANGLFSRYCFKEGEMTYTACAEADADDSMMAMWVELLYRMAPKTGMPKKWKESAEKAEYQLNRLFNQKTTVFNISQALPVGLLMDNIEIYASFKRIEREAVRLGDGKKANEYRGKAEQLKIGITGNFWDDNSKRYIASTQVRTKLEFYPDTVVQLVPMMHGFELSKIASESAFYQNWMNNHRKEWFALIGKDYPWGLLAVLAEQRKDYQTAACWLQLAAPSRHTKVWNVMDETAFQIVSWKMEKKKVSVKECSKGAL